MPIEFQTMGLPVQPNAFRVSRRAGGIVEDYFSLRFCNRHQSPNFIEFILTSHLSGFQGYNPGLPFRGNGCSQIEDSGHQAGFSGSRGSNRFTSIVSTRRIAARALCFSQLIGSSVFDFCGTNTLLTVEQPLASANPATPKINLVLFISYSHAWVKPIAVRDFSNSDFPSIVSFDPIAVIIEFIFDFPIIAIWQFTRTHQKPVRYLQLPRLC